MPRKTTSTTTKPSSTVTKPAVKQPIRSKAANSKYTYEVQLFTGNGKESLFFNDESNMKRFSINVTKRNLAVAALEVTDATGTLFIIRSFQFAKVINHKA